MARAENLQKRYDDELSTESMQGQGLVEFALVVLILVLLLFSLVLPLEVFVLEGQLVHRSSKSDGIHEGQMYCLSFPHSQ